jgi:hypothetical protein
MALAGVSLIISDYNELSAKKADILNCAKEYGVNSYVASFEWTEHHRITEKHPPQTVFSSCKVPSFVLKEKHLYHCPFLAHGAALDVFPKSETNGVNLSDKENLKEKILSYLSKQNVPEACGYCSGHDNKKVLPRAVQVNKPLEYKKYYDF